MKAVIGLLVAVSVAMCLAAPRAAAESSAGERTPRRVANLFTTTAVNLRTGPGTSHRKISVVPADQIVTVHGCIAGYRWCDIDWSGQRGWIYSKVLVRPHLNGQFRNYAEGVGVPVVEFDGESATVVGAAGAVEPSGAQVIVQRIGTGEKADRLRGPASFASESNGDLLGGDVGLQKSVGR